MLRLSASKVSKYLQCPLSYYFSYIEKRREPTTGAQFFGIVIDAGITYNYRQKIHTGTDVAISEISDYVIGYFDAHVKDVLWRPTDTVEVIRDEVLLLTKMYHLTIAPTIQPFSTQEKYYIQIPEYDVLYIGVSDVTTDAGIVIDNKTTKIPPVINILTKQYTLPTGYIFQMTGYGYCYQQKYKKEAQGLRFDFLVRKKNPEYLVIPFQVSNGFTSFLHTVQTVATSITNKSFIPNRLHQYCTPTGCYFWDICKEKTAKVLI